VASLSQGRTAAAQCGLFTHKSVPVIFEPPCTSESRFLFTNIHPVLPFFTHTMHQKVTVCEGPYYCKKLNIARGWVDCSSWATFYWLCATSWGRSSRWDRSLYYSHNNSFSLTLCFK